MNDPGLCIQWCSAKTGGGYTQTGVAKGLKVPCLFIITEVSIRCQKKPGGWYTPYTPNTPLCVSTQILAATADRKYYYKTTCFITVDTTVTQTTQCVYKSSLTNFQDIQDTFF